MSQTIALPAPQLGGRVQTYPWQWQGRSVAVAYETVGTGRSVLLLPAFSTVSCRAELSQLAARLARHCQVTAIDWPGFGESDRPPLDYRPELYRQFLRDFSRETFAGPVAVVAAGHGAGYVIQLATESLWAQIVLLAPTWCGPLVAMGMPSRARDGMRTLVRSPLIGQALYGLNTQPAFLAWMYRRHVFLEAAKLTPDYIARRHRSTQQPGARYAPAAFVTGRLDPVRSREELLATLRGLQVPLLAVIAQQAPKISKAEMEAMAALPNLQAIPMAGTLGMAEEYGDAVATQILPFLQQAFDLG